MLWLLLAALTQAPLVEGLRPGENAVWSAGAPSEGVDLTDRVFHAFTGQPVAGAKIELWREGADPLRLLIPIASTRTGADGTFRLPLRDGAMTADKMIVSAPGFVSFEDAPAGGVGLPLYPAEPFRLRVLDFDGRPIAGARLRTRYTCSHAPPAVTGVSDALGWIEAPEIPRVDYPPEIYVRAPGFHYVLERGSGGRLWALMERDGYAEIYLPRCTPLELRLLTRAGQHVTDRRLIAGRTPGWIGAWLDGRGVARFDSLPLEGHPGLVVAFKDPSGEQYVAYLDPPRLQRVWPLLDGRYAEVSEGSELATLTITVDASLPPEADERAPPRVQVFHEQGWHAQDAGAHRLPPGGGTVVAGGPFTGWTEASAEFELSAEGASVTLSVRPEPRLSVRMPEPERGWELVVQARGAAVRSIEPRYWEDREAYSLSVPPGEPLILMLHAANGELRRLRLPGPAKDTVVEEDAPWEILRRGVDPAPIRRRASVRAVDRQGERVAARLVLREVGRPRRIEPVDEGAASPAHDLPVGRRVFVTASAEGFRTGRMIWEVPAGEGVWRPELVLDRLCRLEVRGEVASIAGGGTSPAAKDGVAVLETVAGPLTLAIWRPDGSRIAVRLNLEKGEHRTLEVR